ncbi:hypothetical protein ASPZODRAFT_137895 [Penicilliopsis zonata CBS 506.65]|uniref:AB hydrolase-1 domain-containing protein n=1 Tax=Penicilliopsis zonata CBS 506.65 TaxID=1073090 RepID=A0A1L9SUL4_9EURO|nr:hypothetical protein ASPZODRAFT_137895 [Penicilliopsis zonata CBS 506.65]OJJ50753.1 hypothetical protein ASPZODRAFT_137895 [Penicilliopsis zonata CBS 506.65]
MSKPTLIFTPGAWYPPTAFDPLIDRLRPHGYPCQTVAFPSIQQATVVTSLQPDIDAVRDAVEPAADAGQDVVVVAHSWSGMPVCSALDGLSKTERERNGKPGGVVKLVFISAFVPEMGESLIKAFGGTPPPWYIRDEANGTVTAEDPYTLFFHDVPDGQAWAGTLRPHAWVTKNSPATGEAYVDIPGSYLLCAHDRAIPLPVQEMLVDRARQKGARIVTETVQTGHSPWLVVPDEVAAYIHRQVENIQSE